LRLAALDALRVKALWRRAFPALSRCLIARPAAQNSA